MSYFRKAHSDVSINQSVDGSPGLRNSQLGALHALGAHFSIREDPGLVVLPTGTGKTAVLMLAPYILLATRVLVITQSRFVRDQIANDYGTLATLKAARVLSQDQSPPKVFANKQRISTDAMWEALRAHDVVVATPNSASPALKGVAMPAADLFDVVIVDEAHHSPAPTWNLLIDSFAGAKVIFLTATPFRRDRKEIKARYLYSYPIQRAFEDGIYGEMEFMPVESSDGENSDEAIARATEQIFKQDTEKGLQHSILVRADSTPRATRLAEVYKRLTSLRLETVDSSRSQRACEKTVQKLRDGELDGVICVNMLGEGFDLPRLKIAALHAPHKSLGVTLQFFGRFARVNGPNLGDARFLAAPAEMSGEMAELFAESDAWGSKIRLLGEERISKEVQAREFLESFETDSESRSDHAIDDVSLYSFSVFNHVKIHHVYGSVDLDRAISVPGFSTVKHWVGADQFTSVALFRESVRPKWATTPGLDRVEFNLVVAFWDEKSRLLFVCSTYREESLYKDVCSSLVEGGFKTLSLNRTNRVLRAFKDLELFNVGIRNRATGTVAESYRQMSGSSAHHSLQKDDAALYHRGHIFGRGMTAEGPDTIGVSSLGKVWRLNYTKISDLVAWCRRLAREIDDPSPFTTGISIDHFDAGADVSEIPDTAILGADWDQELYNQPLNLRFLDETGTELTVSILDLDLRPGISRLDPLRVLLTLEYSHFRTELVYTVGPVPSLEYADDAQPRVEVTSGFTSKDLLEAVGEDQIRFFLGDGSVLQGSERFAPADHTDSLFDAELLSPVDWEAANVEIEREYGRCLPKQSIHDWLATQLEDKHEIVIYDHRSGECADFVGVDLASESIPRISLYHCKASGGAVPGSRTADVYEVAGQSIKSSRFRNRRDLLKHVRRRSKSGSPFLKGTLEDFIDAVNADQSFEIRLDVYIVQPGISASGMDNKISGLLATVNRGLVSLGCNRLRVLCSA